MNKIDSTEQMKRDLAHDIVVGQFAVIALGGMEQAKVLVTAIGKSGAVVRDEKGRTYQVRWDHIIGPVQVSTPAIKVETELTKALPAAEPKRPSMEDGDQIYYRHPDTGAPHHGAVAAVGKHGVLVDADGGGEHKVRWADYIGHKARVQRKLTVIDRGEDGSICTDDAGRRVFIQGEIPDDDEEGLTKALHGEYLAADEARITSAVNAALAPMLSAMESRSQQALAQFARIVEVAIGRPLPAITMQMPETKPANVQVDVHVPKQDAPVINVAAPIQPAPIVNVTVPPKNTVTTVERDREGNITRATQQEQTA